LSDAFTASSAFSSPRWFWAIAQMAGLSFGPLTFLPVASRS